MQQGDCVVAKATIADKRGATTMEYALIIAGLGGLVIAGFSAFGQSVQTAYQSNASAMNGAVDNSFTN